ncbi:GDP-fucose protein O-fucosyltransferase 1 isoform X2 [Daktulosphaira vitifoliae]|uniref:GDP-fucose protein O-fucosyltransferase 1 isoform X2 n=1 Tax=Daktulosphaira vitifoliae TaxID=58002 RepID=UPI0021AA8F2A|nr:GDP-fucose protein O-fucosyltransferase 1 isoform X2 [Daktulosphaira vitifoliae]
MMNLFLYLCILILYFANAQDPKGYIAYCPCMGRFGNQADHFLGALGFAKALDRTLLLPHWIEYRYGQPKSEQVPFDKYFNVTPLLEFHKVQLMNDFMSKLSGSLWPPENRVSFCYMQRGEKEGCNAKFGNPFESFWDTYSIDFSSSEFYSPLNYDVYHQNMANKWNDKYPPTEWPVLAFVGAPASFPIQKENIYLHRYLKWSDEIEDLAKKFIEQTIKPGKFVAIHLRNGIDWTRACDHITNNNLLFSAPQCLGYRNEYGKATEELCFPTFEIIIRQIKRLIRKNLNDISTLYVASDNNHLIPELTQALNSFNVKICFCET